MRVPLKSQLFYLERQTSRALIGAAVTGIFTVSTWDEAPMMLTSTTALLTIGFATAAAHYAIKSEKVRREIEEREGS